MLLIFTCIYVSGYSEYDFEEDENYTTASQVPTEVVNESEVPAFESPPTSSFIDSVFDDDKVLVIKF